MKKIVVLLGIIACFLFLNSCKKSNEKLLVGIWDLKTSAEYFYEDGTSLGGGSTPFELGEVTLEFRKDKTWTQKQIDEPDQNGTYSLDGDQLTINGEAVRMELSETTLALYFTSEQVINGHTQRYESEMHLEKQ